VCIVAWAPHYHHHNGSGVGDHQEQVRAQCRNRYLLFPKTLGGLVHRKTMCTTHITDGHSAFLASSIYLIGLSFPPATFPPPTDCCCLLHHPRTAVICCRRVVFREGNESPLQSVWDLGPPPDRYHPSPSPPHHLSPPKKKKNPDEKCNYTLARRDRRVHICFRQTGLDIDTSSSPCLTHTILEHLMAILLDQPTVL
jgi:hypothetical protein